MTRSVRSKIQSETSLQMQCAGLLDNLLAPPAIYTAFPAGGGGEMRGRILKSMGLKAGMPDIWIMWGQGDCDYYGYAVRPPGFGLYLVELKTVNGRLSQAQIEIHAAIKATLPGAEIAICRSFDEFKAQLDAWKLPRRELSKSNQRFADAISEFSDKFNPAEIDR